MKINERTNIQQAKVDIANVLGAKIDTGDNVGSIIRTRGYNIHGADSPKSNKMVIRPKENSDVASSPASRIQFMNKKVIPRIEKSHEMTAATVSTVKPTSTINVDTADGKEQIEVTIKPIARKTTATLVEEGVVNAILDAINVDGSKSGAAAIAKKGDGITLRFEDDAGHSFELEGVTFAEMATGTPNREGGEVIDGKSHTKKADVYITAGSTRHGVSVKYGLGQAWETATTLFGNECRTMMEKLFLEYGQDHWPEDLRDRTHPLSPADKKLVIDSMDTRKFKTIHYDELGTKEHAKLYSAVFGDDVHKTNKGFIIAISKEFKRVDNAVNLKTVPITDADGTVTKILFKVKTLITDEGSIPDDIKPKLYTWPKSGRDSAPTKMFGQFIQVMPSRTGTAYSKITSKAEFNKVYSQPVNESCMLIGNTKKRVLDMINETLNGVYISLNS